MKAKYKRGDAKSAAAVCTATIGYEGSVRKGHRRQNPIQDPNSSGQGFDPDHEANPYNTLLIENAFHYSHSTPVRRPSGEVIIHHTYKRPIVGRPAWDERNISVWHVPGHGWKWTSSIGGSGRQVGGNARESLLKHLKGIHRERGFGRKSNPLPETSVRPIYYIASADHGKIHYYLKRDGKLTKNATDAARFKTAQEAVDKARAHLAKYPPSRKFRFKVRLAY